MTKNIFLGGYIGDIMPVHNPNKREFHIIICKTVFVSPDNTVTYDPAVDRMALKVSYPTKHLFQTLLPRTEEQKQQVSLMMRILNGYLNAREILSLKIKADYIEDIEFRP